MPNPNKPEQKTSGENPNQPKGVQSATNPSSAHTGNQPGSGSQSSGGRESYSFRCADVGFNDCPWEAKGATPDEVLQKAEQHGREHHRLTNIDEDTRNKVRSKIHRAA